MLHLLNPGTMLSQARLVTARPAAMTVAAAHARYTWSLPRYGLTRPPAVAM